MTAPRVTSRLTYRLNIGNYESFEIVTGIEADALEGESPNDAEERIFSIVEAQLMERVKQATAALIHAKKQPVEG